MAGQSVFVDFLTYSGGFARTQLVAPDGSSVSFGSSSSSADALDNGPHALAQSGTYTLVVDGTEDDTATYQLRLLDVTPQPAIEIPLARPLPAPSICQVKRTPTRSRARRASGLSLT